MIASAHWVRRDQLGTPALVLSRSTSAAWNSGGDTPLFGEAPGFRKRPSVPVEADGSCTRRGRG
jgi:hypothetical protein